jgi:predicted glycosyltransferase
LRQVLAREKFDMVISDNRFGLFSRDVHSVYITHQLYPILPKRLRVFQPFARTLHAYIYRRYDEVWVPDYEEVNGCLSGDLSHGGRFDKKAKYIGPLSRFQGEAGIEKKNNTYRVVAIISGLEPQRTIFEREIIQRFENQEDQILLVRGKMGTPQTVIQKNAMTIVPSITDKDMVAVVRGAEKIIARSGYSTIMDLHALGVLEKAELHPTPGQSEQEYLSSLL